MLDIEGSERVMGEHDMIVSKTNLKGHITYANDVFLNIADFEYSEVENAPHSLVRNPAMPRCVFKLLWQRLEQGHEIFAYVVNKTKFGDYYWVFAHVTPSFDKQGNIVGYHSARRKPNESALVKVKELYAKLLEEEQSHKSRKDGMNAGFDLLTDLLADKGVGYDEFVLSL